MSTVSDRLGVGGRIGGYVVERVEPLAHLGGTYYELRHPPTGARHVHIEVPDTSKAFCVMLPTVPRDSSGVAHILEHCVLAGSERYPVRDPFFSMLPRSLNDFMNAMTSTDDTFYPFSTRNTKDFYNLLDVYLDAVFFPRLSQETFKQEGHRLEYATPDDPSSALQIKGVVFNEMKGAMSSPQDVLFQALGSAVFPDLTYANNYAGDPAKIPDLTWERLREFHAEHYHPSNAHFYTYGDLALDEILDRIESRVLCKFSKIDPDVHIGNQPRFSDARELEAVYPFSESESPAKRSQVIVAWLTVPATDEFSILSMEILTEVLLGNAASPLRQALMGSGLGDTLADVVGFIPAYREIPFAAGLQGVDPGDADQVEAIIMATLAEQVRLGVDPEKVDAAIHQLEIQHREISNRGFPYSLRVFMLLKRAYVYGGDPYESLLFDRHIERLRKELKAGLYFEKLIRTQLLENPHRVRIVLRPDQQLEERRRAAEQARVDAVAATLDEDAKRRLVDDAVRLQQLQMTRPDPAILPTLELSDVPGEDEDVPEIADVIGGVPVHFYPQPTNGITYIDLQFDFAGLSDDCKDALTQFAYAVPRMGAAGQDYLQTAQRIDAVTGGISASVSVRSYADDPDCFQQSLIISGKALARNLDAFVEVLRDVVCSLEVDRKRLAELVGEYRARMEASVSEAGTSYALTLAGSRLRSATALEERLEGLTQLHLLRRWTQGSDATVEELAVRLETVRDAVVRSGNVRVCVTCEPGAVDEMRDRLTALLAALPAGAGPSQGALIPVTSGGPVARTTAVPVAYNARVIKTIGYTHPDAPLLYIAGRYMQDTFLHREIREMGGAYGGGSNASPQRGAFYFYGYRDPHVNRTFDTFGAALEHVTASEIDPTELKEAILSTCKALDPLESPDSRGRRRFFDSVAGFTPERRAEFKRRALAATSGEVRRAVSEHLAGAQFADATIAGVELAEKANDAGRWHVEPV